MFKNLRQRFDGPSWLLSHVYTNSEVIQLTCGSHRFGWPYENQRNNNNHPQKWNDAYLEQRAEHGLSENVFNKPKQAIKLRMQVKLVLRNKRWKQVTGCQLIWVTQQIRPISETKI